MKLRISLSLLALVGVTAMAQEPAAATWSPLVTLGATVTDGNSETELYTAALNAERKQESNEQTILAEYQYGTAGDDKTLDRAKVRLDHKSVLAGDFSLGAYAQGEQDDIANLDSRAQLGVSVGKFLVRSDDASWNLEVGLAYVWEDLAFDDAALDDEYLAVRAVHKLECKLSDTSTLRNEIEYLANTDEMDDYLLNGSLSLDAAVAENLSLTIGVTVRYDSTPARDSAGVELDDTDVTVIAGLTFRL